MDDEVYNLATKWQLIVVQKLPFGISICEYKKRFNISIELLLFSC